MNTNHPGGRFHEVRVKEEEFEDPNPFRDVRIKEDSPEDAKFLLSADNPPTYSPPSKSLQLTPTTPSNYLGYGLTSRWEALQPWLNGIWDKLPAMPSERSCHGWAHNHGVDPLLLDNWFNDKLHTRMMNGMINHPQDGYDLDVDFPPNRFIAPVAPPRITIRAPGVFSTFPFAQTPSYLDGLPRPKPRYGTPFSNHFAMPRSRQSGIDFTPSPLGLPSKSLDVGTNNNWRISASASVSPARSLLTELDRKRKATEFSDDSATTRFTSEDRSAFTATSSSSSEGSGSPPAQSPDKKRARTQEFEATAEVTDETGKELYSDPPPNIWDVPIPAGFPSSYDSEYLADPTSATNFQAILQLSNTINSDLGLCDPAIEGLPGDYSIEPRFEPYTEWP